MGELFKMVGLVGLELLQHRLVYLLDWVRLNYRLKHLGLDYSKRSGSPPPYSCGTWGL